MPSHDNRPDQNAGRNDEMPSADFIRKAAGDDLPAQLLWSLAYHESSFRPWLVNPTSHATGAWQITKPVLLDYNKAKGTTYALNDMKRPELAVLVAAWLLRRVIASWNAASVALKADFGSSRFVSLLVLGWNSGPSAVLRLTKALESAGVAPEAITVDLLHRAAIEHGTPSWIAKPARVAWAKQVATTFAELRDGRKVVVATLVPRPGGEPVQKIVLEKASGGVPTPGPHSGGGVAREGASDAKEGAPSSSSPRAASSPERILPAGIQLAEVESPTSSGLGEAVGAGLTLAVLGLGGAAITHAEDVDATSGERPQ